jgi:psp operon transcriptional activator
MWHLPLMAQDPPELVGQSRTWLDMLEQVSRAAAVNRPILIIGERGTGKELIAERLHYLSPRWNEPFIKVNCAALSEELLDSELFGHEQGAFTGANRKRTGRFEQADGGTLFLDEVATASPRVQEKLLRVVEYGEFFRLGGEDPLRCDVRVVAATNVDLPAQAAAGRFRADLLDRLAFEVVTLAPLRARPDDIELLADHFGRRIARELDTRFPGWSRSALDQMRAHGWPGNVRELKNAAERATYRALATSDDAGYADPIALAPDLLDPFASPFRPSAGPAPPAPGQPVATPYPASAPTLPADGPASRRSRPTSFEAAVSDFEMKLLREALADARGRQRAAADALGLSYHQLRGLLRKYGMSGRGADGEPDPPQTNDAADPGEGPTHS